MSKVAGQMLKLTSYSGQKKYTCTQSSRTTSDDTTYDIVRLIRQVPYWNTALAEGAKFGHRSRTDLCAVDVTQKCELLIW